MIQYVALDKNFEKITRMYVGHALHMIPDQCIEEELEIKSIDRLMTLTYPNDIKFGTNLII